MTDFTLKSENIILIWKNESQFGNIIRKRRQSLNIFARAQNPNPPEFETIPKPIPFN